MAEELDFENLPFDEKPECFVFDVDGTLTDEESRVGPETLAALKNADDAGFPIILATGRLLFGGTNILRRAGVKGWVIAGAGAIVWNGEEVVRTYPIGEETFHRVVDFAKKYQLVLTGTTVNDLLVQAFNPLAVEHAPRGIMENANEGHPLQEVDFDAVDPMSIEKMGVAAPGKVLDALGSQIEEMFPGAVRGHEMFYDSQAPGVDKWKGIKEALDAQGLDPARALGVGDSDNDVPWISRVGFSVSVAGGSVALKQAVRWTLPPAATPVAKLIDAVISD
ncbi:HAD family hydrolase [uncultured Actinobaculum sp.]|uniref:HAD family hydrolase n=1 Tax=uncultured Actinobaculum sp. TaxID=655643 RepID=UPI00280648B7|nr:HAD family hydrolase [uncultured Actinobaculum sp.]